MTIVNTSNKFAISAGVNYIDVSVVLTIFLGWIFFLQVWDNTAAIAMTVVSGVMLLIYLLAMFTGFLPFLSLTKPFWTISLLGAYVVWNAVFTLLPSSVGADYNFKLVSSVSESVSQNLLETFIPKETVNAILNGVWFPFTESLIVAFVAAFFIGVAMRKSRNKSFVGKDGKSNRVRAISPVLFVSAFGAILHTGIALKLLSAGQLDFNVTLFHQFISFFVMTIGSMVVGIQWLIASHLTKNLVVVGTVGLWVVTIAYCVTMDLVSLFITRKSSGRSRSIQSHSYFS